MLMLTMKQVRRQARRFNAAELATCPDRGRDVPVKEYARTLGQLHGLTPEGVSPKLLGVLFRLPDLAQRDRRAMSRMLRRAIYNKTAMARAHGGKRANGSGRKH